VRRKRTRKTVWSVKMEAWRRWQVEAKERMSVVVGRWMAISLRSWLS